MVVFCFCWFLVLYGATFILSENKDIFSPFKFVAVKYAVLNLSFILYICVYPKAFEKNILEVCNVTLNQAFLQYTIVNTVAYLSLLAGMYLFINKKISGQSLLSKIQYNYNALLFLSITAFVIAFSAYLLFLNRIGGLWYLLTNLSKRVELQGNQYILGLLPLFIVSSILLLLCIKLKNKVADKVLCLITIILSILVFSSLGGRIPSIIFMVTLIVAWHYIVRPLTVNKKTITGFAVLGFMLMFYILIVPVIRRSPDQAANSRLKRPYTVKALVYNISYTYIDVFAANYFNENNAWRLKGFFEPVGALFANDDKSMIPQVDQGVYFKSIVKYKENFAPPLPRKDLSKISWPTENFGVAYANFLMPGIVVMFFLQGIIFSLAYRAVIKNAYHPVLIMLYVEIIFNFNFSSLKLAYFIKLVPLLCICYIVFNKFVRREKILDCLKVKL